MKLLVDNQLPFALARHLVANGLECAHVQDIALGAAADTIIWQ
jgi:predicted nuclease of predicted toxin-antitoxin system